MDAWRLAEKEKEEFDKRRKEDREKQEKREYEKLKQKFENKVGK